MMSGFLRN